MHWGLLFGGGHWLPHAGLQLPPLEIPQAVRDIYRDLGHPPRLGTGRLVARAPWSRRYVQHHNLPEAFALELKPPHEVAISSYDDLDVLRNPPRCRVPRVRRSDTMGRRYWRGRRLSTFRASWC